MQWFNRNPGSSDGLIPGFGFCSIRNRFFHFAA